MPRSGTDPNSISPDGREEIAVGGMRFPIPNSNQTLLSDLTLPVISIWSSTAIH